MVVKKLPVLNISILFLWEIVSLSNDGNKIKYRTTIKIKISCKRINTKIVFTFQLPCVCISAVAKANKVGRALGESAVTLK